eukprot:scaffold17647_cov83-Skeletonema_dohrnii-CCMP3373.AAC.7
MVSQYQDVRLKKSAIGVYVITPSQFYLSFHVGRSLVGALVHMSTSRDDASLNNTLEEKNDHRSLRRPSISGSIDQCAFFYPVAFDLLQTNA